MDIIFVQIAGIVVAAVSFGIAFFQILLLLGLPLAEYSWGGKYKGVLPKKMRIISLPTSLILMFFGFVFLIHTKEIYIGFNLPTYIFVWIFTILMAINTLGNLASKSKKERIVMSPLTIVSFLSCVIILILGK